MDRPLSAGWFRRCNRLASTAAVLRAQGLPTTVPESVGLFGERLSNIACAFQKEIDKGNLPGVVVMVTRKGRLAYSEAIGSR